MQEKKERKSSGGLRGVTRLFAVQSLYRADVSGQPIKKIMEESLILSEVFITEALSTSEIDQDFFYALLESTEKNLLIIDELISKNISDKWKIDRLDIVIKSILRLGVTELLYFKDIPQNVVFNEYIEISKAFFDKSEASFVNGILNTIAKLD